MKNEVLTLQELSAYYPYDVDAIDIDNVHCKIRALYEDCVGVEYEMNVGEYEMQFDEIKLCLLPLSSLTKEIEHKGEKFVPYDYFYNDPENDWFEGNVWMNYMFEGNMDKADINFIPFYVIQKLHKWHFDTFGLIERGLAIDKTTL